MRESCQIRITILEARSLKGQNESKGFSVSPQVKMRLVAGEGALAVDKVKYTVKKEDVRCRASMPRPLRKG